MKSYHSRLYLGATNNGHGAYDALPQFNISDDHFRLKLLKRMFFEETSNDQDYISNSGDLDASFHYSRTKYAAVDRYNLQYRLSM